MAENLYDTSKLIESYKKNEAVRGYTTILNLIEFPKALEMNLKVLYPSKSDCNEALKISVELQKLGKPIPAVDLLIAAIALNNSLTLITRDEHFTIIKQVRKDLNISLD